MTAHELATKLLAGPDLPIHQSYNYGDHWRTTVAPATTAVSQGTVRFSKYHNMDAVVDRNEDDYEYRDGDREVIIID